MSPTKSLRDLKEGDEIKYKEGSSWITPTSTSTQASAKTFVLYVEGDWMITVDIVGERKELFIWKMDQSGNMHGQWFNDRVKEEKSVVVYYLNFYDERTPIPLTVMQKLYYFESIKRLL